MAMGNPVALEARAEDREVDPETGSVRIDRYTVVDDIGTEINPLLAQGQVVLRGASLVTVPLDGDPDVEISGVAGIREARDKIEAIGVERTRQKMKEASLIISGNGDVIEPDEGVIGIGSGGVGAQAAATALMRHTDLAARDIVAAAMQIAASLCVFTNADITIEVLDTNR